MTDKIPVAKVLSEDSVISVQLESRAEQLLRAFRDSLPHITAAIVVMGSFVCAWWIMLSVDKAYAPLQDKMWSVITLLIGGGAGYFFGASASK